MHLCRNDLDILPARRAQAVSDPFRGALDVRFVVGLRADARNLQEYEQFAKMLVALGIDVIGQVHGCPLVWRTSYWMTCGIIARNPAPGTGKHRCPLGTRASAPRLLGGNTP